MTPASTTYDARATTPFGWLARAEGWLDSKGRPAWIVAMILGFVFFWPIGLALLAYMIWSKRMFRNSCGAHRARQTFSAMKPTGNTAFDAYKAETLRRLEDEQQSFEAFLQRLRDARDKSEFDQFMDERARKAHEDSAADATEEDGPRA